MPKISELNEITYVNTDDLLAIVHDPNGLPSTNRITVNNFSSSIFSNVSFSHIPQTDSSVDLGTPSKEWRNAYVANAIFIGTTPITIAANGELTVNGVSINPAGGASGYTGSAGTIGNTGYTGSGGGQGQTGYTGSAGQGSSGPYSNLVHGSYTASLNSDGSFSIPSTIKKLTGNYTSLIDPSQNGGGSFVVENFNQYDTPQKITLDGANYVVKISSNSKDFTFANSGVMTLPIGGDIQYANGHSALGGSGGSGYTGSQGDIGYTGSKGDQGYTGSAGAGYVGSHGDIGYTGSRGDLGYTGSIGIGYTGSAGADGAGSGPSSNLINGSYVLSLNNDGSITLPNGGGQTQIMAYGNDYATLTSNTGSEIYYLNSDVSAGLVGPNSPLYSDLYVTSAGMELDIGHNDSSNNQVNHTWMWDQNGNYSLPANGDILFSNGVSYGEVIPNLKGPFANDSNASTGGVPLKGLYYDASGIVHIRLT